MDYKEIARFFGGLTGDIRTATNSKDKDLMTFERFLLDVALNNKDEYVLRFKKEAPPSLFVPMTPTATSTTKEILDFTKLHSGYSWLADKEQPPAAEESKKESIKKPSGRRTCVESVANYSRLVIADVALLAAAYPDKNIAFTHDDFRLFFLTKYGAKTYPSYSTTYRVLRDLATNRMINSVDNGRRTKISFAPTFLLYLKKLITDGNLIVETASSHLAPKVRINIYNEKLEKLWRIVDGFDWYATVYLLWNIVLDTKPEWTNVNKSLVLYQFVEDLLLLLHKTAKDRKNSILFNGKQSVIKTTHRLLLLLNNREYLDGTYFS